MRLQIARRVTAGGRPAAAAAPSATARSWASLKDPGMSTLITCLVTLLLIYLTVPKRLLTGGDPDTAGMATSGDAFSHAVWLTILISSAVIVMSRSVVLMRLIKQLNPFLLAFYLLVVASITWSIEPDTTMRRLVPLGSILMFGFAMAVGPWHPNHFQRAMRIGLLLVVIASILTAHLNPVVGIEQSQNFELLDAWRGVTAQKNVLGSVAAVSVVLWWHGWLTKQVPRWLALICVVLSAYCMLRTRSSTSVMSALFACTCMTMLLWTPKGARRFVPYLIFGFVTLLMIYSLAVLNMIPGSYTLLSPITAITGKDLTFSGRTAIWAITSAHIALRPLLGSGYGAYWVAIPSSPSMEMLRRLYFYPTESHNGYLDIINDLGAVGALMLVGYLFTYVRQALQIFRVDRAQGALYLTLLLMLMIANLSESRWWNVLDYTFAMMTIATVFMARQLMDIAPAPAQRGKRR